jgi:hypothetical protein
VVAGADLGGGGEAEAVEVGAVHGTQVADLPAIVDVAEFGVEAGDGEVRQTEGRARAAADSYCR